MKTILFVLISSSIAFAQDQNDYLQYFPMHHGDIWTYQIIDYDYFNDDTLGIFYRTFEITGDTILANGFKYYTFSFNNNLGFKIFNRIDTTNLTVYNKYSCEYKLDATPDSIWTDCSGMDNYISTDTTFLNDFGVEKPQIIYLQGFSIFNRTLSKDLGLTFMEEGDRGYHTRSYLKYAKIAGVEYGTPVINNIDNNLIPNIPILHQNYPNPFNPITIITYHLQNKSYVDLDIYDIRGRKIKVLVSQNQNAGKHSITFDASGLASGIYIYRVSTGSFEKSRKMVVLR